MSMLGTKDSSSSGLPRSPAEREPFGHPFPRTGRQHLKRLTLLIVAAFVVAGSWSTAHTGSKHSKKGPALWWGSDFDHVHNSPGDDVAELLPAQLKKSGSPTPVTIRETDLGDAMGVAFDPAGNLWVTTLSKKVFEFTKAQLGKLQSDPAPSPAATITSSSSFGFILGCNFDNSGNLWIADSEDNAVHELSASQLAAGSGDITPAVTITDTNDLGSPAFVLFDHQGNLWVSATEKNQLVEFAASDIGQSGTPTPKAIISGPNINSPGQILMDKAGTLWVANAGNASVAGFHSSQIKKTAAPTAAVLLSSNSNNGLDVPWGMTFDRSGALWVFNYTGNNEQKNSATISKFTKKQLVTGSPTPKVMLSGFPLYAGELAFGPSHKGQ